MLSLRRVLIGVTIALLSMASGGAFAQKVGVGPSSNVGISRPTGPVGPTRGGGDFGGGGFRGPGWGAVVPGVIMAVPQGYPANGVFIDGQATTASRRVVAANTPGVAQMIANWSIGRTFTVAAGTHTVEVRAVNGDPGASPANVSSAGAPQLQGVVTATVYHP